MPRIFQDQKSSRPTNGYDLPSGSKRVMITFDEEAFKQIQAEAKKRGLSFSTVCREVIAAGLAP